MRSRDMPDNKIPGISPTMSGVCLPQPWPGSKFAHLFVLKSFPPNSFDASSLNLRSNLNKPEIQQAARHQN